MRISRSDPTTVESSWSSRRRMAEVEDTSFCAGEIERDTDENDGSSSDDDRVTTGQAMWCVQTVVTDPERSNALVEHFWKFLQTHQTVTTESVMANDGAKKFPRQQQASLPSIGPAEAPVAKEVSGSDLASRNASVRENTTELTEGRQSEPCQSVRERREPGADDKSSSSAESRGMSIQHSGGECEAPRHKPQHQISKSQETITEGSSAHEQRDERVPPSQLEREGVPDFDAIEDILKTLPGGKRSKNAEEVGRRAKQGQSAVNTSRTDGPSSGAGSPAVPRAKKREDFSGTSRDSDERRGSQCIGTEWPRFEKRHVKKGFGCLASTSPVEDIMSLLAPPRVPVAGDLPCSDDEVTRLLSHCTAFNEVGMPDKGSPGVRARAQMACLDETAGTRIASVTADFLRTAPPAVQEAFLELLLSWYYAGFFSGRLSMSTA
ncbi:hypothetical protein CSUI_004808 [Cystoisospora suis]|uniref:Uncharacterized protein n=1 Tax=Cystoisospora suis TaxID=483139 RepID=A0A2C6L058_9APIC|nr:hypothetical protein CSUI_004808 [Cystoisospora suis]